METFLCFLKWSLMGLILAWVGLIPAGFASIQDSDVASFAMYSYSPSPVKVNGSARLPEGEVVLPVVPFYIKQAIFSPRTTNPFKSVYRNVYTPVFLKQLQGCPFIGMPYDLDGNMSTKEWIVITLFYGCVEQYDNYISSQPHNWILQQDAKKQFRILMESDGRSLLAVKDSSRQKKYDKLFTNHYIVNFAPVARPQCGMSHVKWQYRQNRYQVNEQKISAEGCEQLFKYGGNEILPEAAQNDNKKKAQKAVEAVVAPWLKQLQAIR
ncbi:MAG: hypothetical protein RLZZ422_297 [Pseudomonadota bacterium]|jgi:hypothetical protein